MEEIGYSEKTLWSQINHQWERIDDEVNWMNHYIATGEVECVGDCVNNIADGLTAIRECLALIKEKEM